MGGGIVIYCMLVVFPSFFYWIFFDQKKKKKKKKRMVFFESYMFLRICCWHENMFAWVIDSILCPCWNKIKIHYFDHKSHMRFLVVRMHMNLRTSGDLILMILANSYPILDEWFPINSCEFYFSLFAFCWLIFTHIKKKKKNQYPLPFIIHHILVLTSLFLLWLFIGAPITWLVACWLIYLGYNFSHFRMRLSLSS